MNDRYLFKAKNFATGNWHKGFLIDVSGDRCTIRENDSYWACNSESLCQCTGLEDKAGTLIWENDIVSVTGYSYTEPEFDLCGKVTRQPELLEVER